MRQVAELFPMTVIGIVVKYVCGKCDEKQATDYRLNVSDIEV